MNANGLGYVLFSDERINQRVYYSYHRTLKTARNASRRFRKSKNVVVNIGIISRAEYDSILDQ